MPVLLVSANPKARPSTSTFASRPRPICSTMNHQRPPASTSDGRVLPWKLPIVLEMPSALEIDQRRQLGDAGDQLAAEAEREVEAVTRQRAKEGLAPLGSSAEVLGELVGRRVSRAGKLAGALDLAAQLQHRRRRLEVEHG